MIVPQGFAQILTIELLHERGLEDKGLGIGRAEFPLVPLVPLVPLAPLSLVATSPTLSPARYFNTENEVAMIRAYFKLQPTKLSITRLNVIFRAFYWGISCKKRKLHPSQGISFLPLIRDVGTRTPYPSAGGKSIRSSESQSLER